MTRYEERLTGLIVGAGLMYLIDPARGARRRAMLRDQVGHWTNRLEDGLDTAARDARYRTWGLAAEARGLLSRDHASDAVVEARVRTELGRAVSHPGAIDVLARGGRVTVSGPVLADEVDRLLAQVRAVRGVDEVENRLDVHESAGDVPGLQGNARRREPRMELMQENWAPSVRLTMGLLGGALTLRGVRMSGIAGTAESALGLALLARAATNLPMSRLTGVDAGRRAVELRKAINIAAPIEEVWDLWSDFENFPRFMAHLKEVRITGERRSHWVAAGPAGSTFEWDAEITQWVPREAIAWKSAEDATVANAGVVRFLPTAEGGTHVEVQMSYNPPAGSLGHIFAAVFGSDPKQAMDEDLVRLKSLLEVGRTTGPEGTVTLEELEPAVGGTTG